MPRNFIPWWEGWGFVFLDVMRKKEKVKKASDIIENLFHLLSFVQWLIAIICLPGTTIMVVVIMPAIDLLIAFLLGIGITIVVVFMALCYNIEKKKLDIEKVKIRDKRKSGPF